MGGRTTLGLVVTGLTAWLLTAVPPAPASSAEQFPQTPPNDPSYAPAESGPQACSEDSVNDEQFYMYSFMPRCAVNAADPDNASGMSIDAAWRSFSVGRPDTVIAYVEGGINWHAGDIADLVNKVYLNWRELPVPCTGDPCVTRYGRSIADYEVDHDGVFNAADYAHDPRVHDTNDNGVIDPEDIIASFSCYDRFNETIGRASWPGGKLSCSNRAERVDNDGDGYPHDISGWDFYDDQNDPATVDGAYGHANDQMRQAAAQTDNGAFGAGICPACMILPVKAGAEALDSPTDLAEAWLFAADAGASVVVSVTADLGHSSFLSQAAKSVEDRGVAIVESSNDFDSSDHQGGMFLPGVLPGNGLVSDTAGVSGASAANSGLTTYRARSDLTSFGPHNVFSVTTQGGSTSESTPTLGGVLALLMAYGRTAAERHLISTPLTGDEAAQVLRETASPIEDPSLPWPGSPGWNEQYGYGRPDVSRAMQAVAANEVPPIGSIDSPDWYSIYDPASTRDVEVTGEVQAPRSKSYRWVLQAGVGPQPATFTTIGGGSGTKPFHGVLGSLDLARVPKAFWSAPYRLSSSKEVETADQYAVTLRLRVTDAKGHTGEDRRAIYVHHDPTLLAGFPLRLGHGGESQPALVDLRGSGHLDIVFGDSDGYVHAVDPATGKELPGWPVHTDPVAVPRSHKGVNPGYEPVIANVAVGDLDHTGQLSVVATSVAGKVYVFGAGGKIRAGWPRAMDTGVVAPQVPRPDLPMTRLPVQGAGAAPVLYDLTGGGRLDVIQAGWDGSIHAYNPDGRDLPGWPVSGTLPRSYPTDPGYHLVDDANLTATPAIALFPGQRGPSVVERIQQTEVTGGGLQPFPFGFLVAYDAAGNPIPGWPVKVPGLIEYYGSAQQAITEGTDSPVSASVLGDGFDQVAVNPVFTPSYVFDGAGSRVGTYGSLSAPVTQLLAVQAANGKATSDPSSSGDEPLGFSTTGAFGHFGGSLAFAQGGTGAQSLAAATQFPGSGNPIYSYLRAYGAASESALPGFPAQSQGLSFLGAPIITGVTADRQEAIVASDDSSALEAYTASGSQAPGFPKFYGGWSLWSPSAGDLLSDGHDDLVLLTREGYLFAWRTDGSPSANSEWWSYHHDEWHTGRYGTDTRPPGAIRRPVWRDGASELSFVAPGGDWYSGTVAHYVVSLEGGFHEQVAPSGPAGTTETVAVPERARCVTVQAVDNAGNLGHPTTVCKRYENERRNGRSQSSSLPEERHAASMPTASGSHP